MAQKEIDWSEKVIMVISFHQKRHLIKDIFLNAKKIGHHCPNFGIFKNGIFVGLKWPRSLFHSQNLSAIWDDFVRHQKKTKCCSRAGNRWKNYSDPMAGGCERPIKCSCLDITIHFHRHRHLCYRCHHYKLLKTNIHEILAKRKCTPSLPPPIWSWSSWPSWSSWSSWSSWPSWTTWSSWSFWLECQFWIFWMQPQMQYLNGSLKYFSSSLFHSYPFSLSSSSYSRHERSIETIPSFDQWSSSRGPRPLKTVETNGRTTQTPLKKHWGQWSEYHNTFNSDGFLQNHC